MNWSKSGIKDAILLPILQLFKAKQSNMKNINRFDNSDEMGTFVLKLFYWDIIAIQKVHICNIYNFMSLNICNDM